MERKDYAEKFRDIKDEILDEIRGILGNGEKHYFKETFFVHYVEGEVATTEVCSALEISEKGMVVFHVINSVQDAEKIEAHGVYAYDPESFLNILDHLKKEVREEKLAKIKELVHRNGGDMSFDGKFDFNILDNEIEVWPCYLERLYIDYTGGLIIDNTFEGGGYTNGENSLLDEDLDKLIAYVESQCYKTYEVTISEVRSRKVEIKATTFDEAVEQAKELLKKEPLNNEDSNGIEFY